ncbi:interleukin-1 receptor type 2 [Colossoma macropomum]|uniref:interleukin-1 receptor type 2 n=1 Tax=Colossoma macropomum TaxID=42526 RepID=UPI001863D58C|nr:interleukin-1 receptor type 2 [Colossoma macropomum]
MMTIREQCVLDFRAWIFMSVGLAAVNAVPIKDSCSMVGPEIPDFHTQGEAVVIRFPFLENVISYKGLQVDSSATFHVSHSNHSDLHNQSHRVIQRERVIWLLPSLPSDTGTYTYVFRSSTFCYTGEISVTIYKTGREDMDMMSHPVSAQPDKDLTIICPHTDHFKKKESPQWFKGFHSEAFPLKSARYNTGTGDLLTIRNISVEDEGLYTCRLTVTINNTHYNVSRIWKLQVLDPDTDILDYQTEPTTNSMDEALTSSSLLYPYITTPVNGSIIESHVGSSLAIQCEVFVGSQSLDFTEVTWLVNGQLPEHSYLNGRAFQANRKVSGSHIEVQLVILEVHEEDMSVELKCVAKNVLGKQEVITQIKVQDSTFVWLVTAAIASSFFLLVVSVFLHLLRPRWGKQNEYILARQNSTF